MAEDMKPHVAFLPSSGMGHIFPLFQLTKQLILHHGFRVSFIVITTEASASQNHFFQSSAALLPGLSIIDLPPADVSGIITDDMRLVTRLSIIVRESLKPVKSILLELKPTSLIIDIFTTDAIDVCKELLIPVYSFFTASTVCLTFSLCLPTLDCEVEGEFVDLPAPGEIPGCQPLRTEDLIDQVKDRKNDEYKWFLFHVSRLPYTSGIFLNAWEDLDPARLTALNENPFFKSIPTPPVFPVGPLIKDGEILTEKDAEILAWLDAQPCGSVLYVSLGSGGTLSSGQLIELAWGLEMSRQRFILVVSQKDPRDGAGGTDMGVLAHPSTGAFLSHCGWNSTLESLVHGKPMIAWPLYAEQRMNATMLVEEVRVAVKLGRAEVIGREEIERVVMAVMEGEQGNAVRLRARELKESAHMASESSVGRVLDIWKSKN
ncbi:UNVERIFIED_CONTAM: Anthocyanidin 3-O-glucosyltransferase 5 [Sesamum angustifolium]|uniref:Anthocyanidin 3-O-glucosyltransferase 5 n=1 Tax=Sesamum angustifolium TaxID=2727405 RepID=A0AAW2N8P5_9LAMI